MSLTEELIAHVFKEIKGIDIKLPLKREWSMMMLSNIMVLINQI